MPATKQENTLPCLLLSKPVTAEASEPPLVTDGYVSHVEVKVDLLPVEDARNLADSPCYAYYAVGGLREDPQRDDS